MSEHYKAPEAELLQQQDTLQYAGFGLRLGASILDSIWIIALTLSLGWMVYGMMYFESEAFVKGTADIFISYVLPFMLTMGFWFYKSATPGKMLLGMIIVDADTLQAPSKRQLGIRYFSYYLSMLPLFLGFFWVIWDDRKQGWHDKLAGTLVIKKPVNRMKPVNT